MVKQSAWSEAFFADAYLEVYAHQRSLQRAREEVDFVLGVARTPAGAGVLDVCCGPSLHSIELARQGFSVVGADLSQRYLKMRLHAADEAGVALDSVRADMRSLPFHSHFSLAIQMGTSFGFFAEEEEDAQVLRSVSDALIERGIYVLDLQNREWVLKNQPERDWSNQQDGAVGLQRSSFDLETSRQHQVYTVIEADGQRRELGGHDIRLYTLREITRMLSRAGLRFVAAFGDFKGRPYRLSSHRMIVVAIKSD